MADRRYDGPPGAAVGSPAEPAGAWLFDCPALPCHQKRRDRRQAKRVGGFLYALSVLRSGRFALCHVTAGFVIRRSARSGTGAGRFMELRWSVLAERRRNEVSSYRGGGGRLAVRCRIALGSGVAGNEGCAGQRQLACGLGRAAQTERSGVRRLWYRVPRVGYGQRW